MCVHFNSKTKTKSPKIQIWYFYRSANRKRDDVVLIKVRPTGNTIFWINLFFPNNWENGFQIIFCKYDVIFWIGVFFKWFRCTFGPKQPNRKSNLNKIDYFLWLTQFRYNLIFTCKRFSTTFIQLFKLTFVIIILVCWLTQIQT